MQFNYPLFSCPSSTSTFCCLHNCICWDIHLPSTSHRQHWLQVGKVGIVLVQRETPSSAGHANFFPAIAPSSISALPSASSDVQLIATSSIPCPAQICVYLFNHHQRRSIASRRPLRAPSRACVLLLHKLAAAALTSLDGRATGQ